MRSSSASTTTSLPLPSSSTLNARLRTFLPVLASANVALDAIVAERGPAAVDIEAVDEGAAHIAMEVALTELAEDDDGADSSSSSDDSSSSSSDSSSKKDGGGGGGAGAGVSRVSRVSSFRIQEVGGGDGGGNGDGSAGAATGGVSIKTSDIKDNNNVDDIPSGEWLTGAALDLRRNDIMRLIAASGSAAETSKIET